MALSLSGGKRSIDLEDLIPAQIAGVMFLIQFGIAELIAYDTVINLDQTYDVGVANVSLAFLISAGSFLVIVLTNELTADDVLFWDEDTGELDQIYGAAIAATAGLLVAIEFSTYINDLVTSSDVLGTIAFVVSVVAIWSIVWLR